MSRYILQIDDFNVSAGEVHILKDITFTAKSGDVIAMMGPSGAGKTTLINSLTTPQLPKQYTTSGEIRLNGDLMSKYANSGKLIGYCPQGDCYYSEFTLRQHLHYKGELKFPNNVSKADRCERIIKVVRELGIEHCIDSILGGETNKAMSGGEIKRAMVATEMIPKPPILVLDEPTTGLDSYAAKVLIDSLVTLAHEEKCVILLSVHQPSSDLYFSFSRVIWLAKGYLMADCTPKQLVKNLKEVDLACPPGEDVANHMMDLLQEAHSFMIVQEEKDRFIAKCDEESTEGMKSITAIMEERNYPGRFKQFITLTKRQWVLRYNMYTEISVLLNKFLLAVICMLVFWEQWGHPSRITPELRNSMGFFWFYVQHWSYDSYYTSRGSVEVERSVARSELSTRVYGNIEFSLSKILPDTFWLTMFYAFVVIVGLCSGQAWNAIEWWRWICVCIIGLLHILALNILSKATSHWIRDDRSSAIIGDVYLTTGCWVSGFYIRTTTIPEVLKWFRWIANVAQAYNLTLHTAYDDLEFICEGQDVLYCDGMDHLDGQGVLENYGIDIDLWYNIVFLVGFCFVFEIIAVTGAKYSGIFRNG